MDDLRNWHAEMKDAENARNTLIEDLLQKLDDMQKTMDKNAFVLVLIDGDCMNFLDELFKQEIAGGDEAVKLLQDAVFDYLRHDPGYNHNNEIVIRVYANLRGLSKAYADNEVLSPTTFNNFLLRFNKARPLCDSVDAGNHKEAADAKLKETLRMHIYNVHCKSIIFGAFADNGYASFINAFPVNTDVSSRLRLLEGQPFSFEFQNILHKFKSTKFANIFRSDMISNNGVQSSAWRRSQELGQTSPQETAMGKTSTAEPFTWPTKREGLQPIYRNSLGQRLDVPQILNVDVNLVKSFGLRKQHLCNPHYLVRECTNRTCNFDHDAKLSDREVEALKYVARSQRCREGSDCTQERCIKGHICPNGKYCSFGDTCRFADLHDIDTTVANQVY